MDTKNLQLINDFGEGMNTDTSDALISKSSYRLANNLRYITNTSENSGELHMIEGTTVHCVFYGEKIIGATNLRDVEIYITQEDVELPTYWKVYTKEVGNVQRLIAVIPAQKDRVINHKLSLVTKYEDEDNLKLYIADGAGPIITINIASGETLLDFDQIVSYPSVNLSKPVFCGLINGSINAAVVAYSYQLYKKYGQLSEISVSTKLIPLYKGDIVANNARSIQGYMPEETTDKGVVIKIKLKPEDLTSFDNIKVYRISYAETGLLPTIDCIIDNKIDNTTITVADTGLSSLLVLTLEEYNAITGVHIVPKVIESKDDYLFAANIKNEKDSSFHPEWSTIKDDIEYSIKTATVYADACKSDDKIDHPKIEDDNYKLTRIVNCEGYDFDTSCYIDAEYNEDVNSYDNSKVSYLFRSLRRGETYRFGIVLYNEDGVASPVYYYDDIYIETSTPIFEIIDERLVVHPVGVYFKVNRLPEGTKLYEIVRCGRSVNDIQTIAQGVLSRPISRSFSLVDPHPKATFPLTPTGFVTTSDIIFSLYNDSNIHLNIATNMRIDIPKDDDVVTTDPNYDIFLFISPEISYVSDTIKDTINKTELVLEPILYLYPTKEIGPIEKSTQLDPRYTPWSQEEISARVYNVGNKYANFTTKTEINSKEVIYIKTPLDPLWSYYTAYDEESGIFNIKRTDEGTYSTVDTNWFNTTSRFQYTKMYNLNELPISKTSFNITSTGFPETLNWDDFATPQAENYTLRYIDKVTAVGGRNFVNWVCGASYGMTDKYPDEENGFFDLISLDAYNGSVMGPGGKCMVFRIDSEEIGKTDAGHFIGTYLCNIKKKTVKQSDSEDINRSTYRSFGDLFDSTKTDSIVFDGDCFINVFEYVAQHKFAHISDKFFRTSCNVYAIPLETSVNLAYTSGYEFSKYIDSSSGDITYVQNEASNVNGIFIQDKPLYTYNSVYSATDTTKTLISKELFDKTNDLENTDYRVYHSLQKSNNESVDNWLKFLPANFLDVDTRRGPITGLRRFKNSLVFWLKCATGLLSVNERSMITDESNLPLILGSGGVLARADYISDVSGMSEDDYADAQSNTTLYWWDRTNKAICGYSGGQLTVEMSKIRFIQNYLNKNNPLDNPSVVYDNKFNEAIFSVVDGSDYEKGSVAYNENLQRFTSIYTVNPKHAIQLPEKVIMTTDSIAYNWDSINGSLVYGFESPIYPYLKYVINALSIYTKTFDNGEFGGRVYGGNNLSMLSMEFSTPLKQHGVLSGSNIQNREYNFKYVIPRNNVNGHESLYGDRLRGKTMLCELKSSSNSYDFSLQFIMNKFRISWS